MVSSEFKEKPDLISMGKKQLPKEVRTKHILIKPYDNNGDREDSEFTREVNEHFNTPYGQKKQQLALRVVTW